MERTKSDMNNLRKSIVRGGLIILVFGFSLIYGQGLSISTSGPQMSYSYDNESGFGYDSEPNNLTTSGNYTTLKCGQPLNHTSGTPITCMFQRLNVAFCLDAPMSVIKYGSYLNFFNFNTWGTDIYQTTDPANPCATRVNSFFVNYVDTNPECLSPVWLDASDFIKGGKFYDSFYPCFNPFVVAMYHLDGSVYLGIVHLERLIHCDVADSNDPHRVYTIGIALSTNSGLQWTYCGDIIKPQAQKMDSANPCQFNICGGSYIINKANDSMYIYFMECPKGDTNGNQGYLSVAAANLTSVTSDACNLTVTQNSWQKYYNGKWNSGGGTNAFNGVGSNILPELDTVTASHGFINEATYCTAINKYLLLVVGWYDSEYCQSMHMYSSSDGISWTNYRQIDNAPYGSNIFHGGTIGYASFSALPNDPNAATDFHQVGRVFYINYPMLPHVDTVYNKRDFPNYPYKYPDIYHANIYYQRIVVTPDFMPCEGILLGN